MVSEKMQPYYNGILEGWGFRNIFWTTEEDPKIAKYLDRNLHIDLLFRDPKNLRTPCQAKDLSYKFERRYQTLTVTCHNGGDEINLRKSELFTCMADYFLCGYHTENEDGVVSAIIVDFNRFREHLFTKLTEQDIKDAQSNKESGDIHGYLDVGEDPPHTVFVRVSFCELIDAWPSDIVVNSYFTKEGKQTIQKKRRAYRLWQDISFSDTEEELHEEQS